MGLTVFVLGSLLWCSRVRCTQEVEMTHPQLMPVLFVGSPSFSVSQRGARCRMQLCLLFLSWQLCDLSFSGWCQQEDFCTRVL